MSLPFKRTNKIEVIYVQDALCGWCYGFTPVMDQLRLLYSEDELTITPVHGGLWPGILARKMDASLVSHLQNGMPKVTEITGQVFGKAFHHNIVGNPQFVYDTEPAARAGTTVRFFSPIHELTYIKDIQKAFFVDGLDPTQMDTFLSIIVNYGINKDDFIRHYNNKLSSIDTQSDFFQCSTWGIKAFPSLLCRFNGQVNTISIGSCSLEHIVSNIDHLEKRTLPFN